MNAFNPRICDRGTSSSMSTPLASCVMSCITATPPGRSTRCISLRAVIGCLKFLKAAWQTIRSNDSAGNGQVGRVTLSKVDSNTLAARVVRGDLDHCVADVQATNN